MNNDTPQVTEKPTNVPPAAPKPSAPVPPPAAKVAPPLVAPGPALHTAGSNMLKTPSSDQNDSGIGARLLKKMRNSLGLMLMVVLPTLLSALYFSFWASDQFETEAKISVRSQNSPLQSSMLGSMLGANIGRADGDSISIVDYVQSHNAVQTLDKSLNLREMFTRPEADLISKLADDASGEELVEYYRKRVSATFDSNAGSTLITVRAFTAEDALKIAQSLIVEGENLVNEFNRRAEEDALRVARNELERTRQKLAEKRVDLATFRQGSRELDPVTTSTSALEVISKLTAEATSVSAKLKAMESYMTPNAPQVRAQRDTLNALHRQIEIEKHRLTTGDGEMMDNLSAYEVLMMERELAEKEYLMAIAAVENARLQAQQQQNYVVSVVSPHLSDESTYPRRLEMVLLTLLASLLVYGIGRLIMTGVRDHIG